MKNDAILRKPQGFWSNNGERWRDRDGETKRSNIWISFRRRSVLERYFAARRVAVHPRLSCFCVCLRAISLLSFNNSPYPAVSRTDSSILGRNRAFLSNSGCDFFQFSVEFSSKKKRNMYVTLKIYENLFVTRTTQVRLSISEMANATFPSVFRPMVRRSPYHRSNKTLLFITRSIAVSARFDVDKKKKERQRERKRVSLWKQLPFTTLGYVHVHACTFVI